MGRKRVASLQGNKPFKLNRKSPAVSCRAFLFLWQARLLVALTLQDFEL
jgi:hypothetical protein